MLRRWIPTPTISARFQRSSSWLPPYALSIRPWHTSASHRSRQPTQARTINLEPATLLMTTVLLSVESPASSGDLSSRRPRTEWRCPAQKTHPLSAQPLRKLELSSALSSVPLLSNSSPTTRSHLRQLSQHLTQFFSHPTQLSNLPPQSSMSTQNPTMTQPHPTIWEEPTTQPFKLWLQE